MYTTSSNNITLHCVRGCYLQRAICTKSGFLFLFFSHCTSPTNATNSLSAMWSVHFAPKYG